MLVSIAFRSVVVYLFVILAIRLFGKKELTQLSVVDLVFILLISNSLQAAMVGTNTTLVGGLVAAGSLFFANWVLNFFKFVIFSLITLAVYAGAQYFIASKYGTSINYNFWNIQRFGYTKRTYLRPIKFIFYKILLFQMLAYYINPLTFLNYKNFFRGIIGWRHKNQPTKNNQNNKYC